MSETAHLCAVRHGETDWNVAGILQGWCDVPLNDFGRAQSRELATLFADEGFTSVWTSPLIRARETARIVAGLLGLPEPTCHDGLRERHFGAVQGVPKTELAERNPVLLQQIVKRCPATVFEGGESMDAFADRIVGALEDIGGTHPGERILVITHGWVMDVITRHIHGLPRSQILNLKRKNGESVWLEVTATEIVDGRAIHDAMRAGAGSAKAELKAR